MTSNEKQALIEYLKEAIQQETDVITQERIIAQYDEDSERRKPVLPEKRSIERPQTVEYEGWGGGMIFLMWVVLILGIFTIVLGFSAGAFVSILGAMMAIIGGTVIIKDYSGKKAAREENERRQKEYDHQANLIEDQYNAAQSKYYDEIRKWNSKNESMHSIFAGPLEKSRWILSKTYESEMIYPKYHNLPALTSICEYLITGRCDELTGPHGAYNLYEDEVRKDMVISQMNTIIANLESIKNNQYMLYEQVQAIQENTTQIGAELRQIKGYTVALTELVALNTYYMELQERNTRYIALHHWLS